MTTDISEKGLEAIIIRAMTGRTNLIAPPYTVSEISPAVVGGTGWILGDPKHYDRGACVDLVQLRGFLLATQPKLVEILALETDVPTRRQFLARLEKEVARRGVIDVLRKGIDHGAHHIELFYTTPSPENEKQVELFSYNRFSVTRQLAYSREQIRRALDLCLFVNGLPVATFELKNSLTKQTVQDAVEQYCRDRDSREPLFTFGRCAVHWAVDDANVKFCTELKDRASWFLPFDQGYHDGAGNPPNPHGLKTAYLWEQILTPEGLTDIIENYAQIVEEKDRRTGKKKSKQVFPRYHQLDVVRKILADLAIESIGKRYLIQHSAGSGKSNSITWLAHQLIGVKRGDKLAFTATPKNKTLEIFGEALPPDAEGKVQHRPFHSYTMKQAIDEGFILDVLKSYTPVNSYYRLVKTIEGDPEYEINKARKKLRRYVEGHETALRLKAEIMVDHFHEQVIALRKIKGQARAMVVTSSIERAVGYFQGVKSYLEERKSPYAAIVAFSGERDTVDAGQGAEIAFCPLGDAFVGFG